VDIQSRCCTRDGQSLGHSRSFPLTRIFLVWAWSCEAKTVLASSEFVGGIPSVYILSPYSQLLVRCTNTSVSIHTISGSIPQPHACLLRFMNCNCNCLCNNMLRSSTSISCTISTFVICLYPLLTCSTLHSSFISTFHRLSATRHNQICITISRTTLDIY
jgi:hypothetical protein